MDAALPHKAVLATTRRTAEVSSRAQSPIINRLYLTGDRDTYIELPTTTPKRDHH